MSHHFSKITKDGVKIIMQVKRLINIYGTSLANEIQRIIKGPLDAGRFKILLKTYLTCALHPSNNN